MCLILLAHKLHPRIPLILAANRDEFHDRPTAALDFWPENGDLLAGRDLRAGGTWFGVTRGGRWAAVTNFRAPAERRTRATSRGKLVSEFLTGADSAASYLEELATADGDYNGFNLLLGDGDGVYHYSNRSGEVTTLEPGCYGLSNHLLDTPWPKVRRGKAALRALLDEDAPVDPESLLTLLNDLHQPPDDELPDTGIPRVWERRLGPMFILGTDYGTRSSTVLLGDGDNRAICVERTFGPADDSPLATGTQYHEFEITIGGKASPPPDPDPIPNPDPKEQAS